MGSNELKSDEISSRINKLNSSGKFKVSPNDAKVGKTTKKILNSIKQNINIDYLFLLKELDMKPSKLDKKLKKLEKLSLVEISGNIITITDSGMIIIEETKKEKTNKENFKKFVGTLSEKEFNQFYDVCNSLTTDNDNDSQKEDKIANK